MSTPKHTGPYRVGPSPFNAEQYLVTVEHRDHYEIISRHDTIDDAWAAKARYETRNRNRSKEQSR